MEELVVETPYQSSQSRGLPWRLAAATVAVCLCMISIGMSAGYPSPAVPDINSHRNPFHISIDQQSWYVSLDFIGGMVGPFPAGVLCDRYGRKTALLVSTVPFVVGWTLVSSAQSIVMLDVARVLLGISETLYLTVTSVYLTEVAPLWVRGLLIALHDVFLSIGFLLVYVAGTFVHWNWLAIVCAALPVLATVLVLAIPESPRWLVQHGELERAAEALRWFNGAEYPADSEIHKIQAAMKDSASHSSWIDLFRCPLLKYLATSQALFVFREFSNIPVLRTYAVTIFQSTGSALNPYVAGIVLGAIMLAGTVFCALVIDRFRRTVLLTVSLAGLAISMAALGAFFLLQDTDPGFTQRYLTWLPLASAIGATFSYTLGCGPLPHLLTNEMFPTDTRGRAHSLAVFTAYGTSFLTTKYFADIQSSIGSYGAFWISAGLCLIGAVFAWCLVPETKGKSLEDIQKDLK